MNSLVSSRKTPTSGLRKSFRIRSNACTNSSGVSARITPRLPERRWFKHAGKGDFRRGNNRARIRVQGKSLEARNIQPGIPQPLARAVFVAADVGRFGRMSPQAEFMAGASAG